MTLRQKVASTSQPSSVLICAPHYNKQQVRDVGTVLFLVTDHVGEEEGIPGKSPYHAASDSQIQLMEKLMKSLI
jgi:hypothetical protein